MLGEALRGGFNFQQYLHAAPDVFLVVERFVRRDL